MDLKGLIGALIGEARAAEAEVDGVYYLEIDGQTLSVLEIAETNQMLIWSGVGDLPPEGCEAFYRMMLEAMSPGGAADDMALSIDPESKSVFLHWMDDLAVLTAETLMARLIAFAGTLVRWKAELGDFRPPVVESGAGDNPSLPQTSFGPFMQV